MCDENKSFSSNQSLFLWEPLFATHRSFFFSIFDKNYTKQQNKTEQSNVADLEVRKSFLLD